MPAARNSCLDPRRRVVVADNLADAILLQQRGVLADHFLRIERRHLPAQHINDRAVACPYAQWLW